MTFGCGAVLPPGIPDAGQGACCWGAAYRGPQGCTCWEPAFDLDQAGPAEGLPEIPVPVRPCHDCAYNHDSPEKAGDDRYTGDAEALERLAARGDPFYCHQGIRRVTGYRHPSGAVYPASPGDYQPPIVGSVPYRADGRPALLCAGWLLRAAVLRRQREAG